MTNEEAINILKRGYPDINKYAASEYEDYQTSVALYDMAINLAIKVLEADRWVPVSERLPDKEDYYYVWISDSDGNERPCSNWFDGEIFTLQGVFGYTVLAWKKMYQEPYKESEDK